MRLLATLATAALVVWGANRAAERIDPELWRAPAVAVREGLAQAVREVAESDPAQALPAPSESAAETEPADPAPPGGRHPEPPPTVTAPEPATAQVKTPVEPSSEQESTLVVVALTPEEAEAIRSRLERVMQLARVGAR